MSGESREAIVARSNRERAELFAAEIERVSILSKDERELLFSLVSHLDVRVQMGRRSGAESTVRVMGTLIPIVGLSDVEYEAWAEAVVDRFCLSCGEAKKEPGSPCVCLEDE